MLGYMEQTVSVLMTKALTSVGLARPKYPFLTTSESALHYIALYLKANNPKSVCHGDGRERGDIGVSLRCRRITRRGQWLNADIYIPCVCVCVCVCVCEL